MAPPIGPRAWNACGTIASTHFASLLPTYEPGQRVDGGHPYSLQDHHTGISDMAVSADGGTLVTMGGVTLVWDLSAAFVDSVATYVDGALPEWPRVDVSRDGRWISIFGDGRRVISRDGVSTPRVSAGEPQCWPSEAVFSPDGRWLAGAGFSPTIDVFRVADLDAPPGTAITPVASLPAPCGPAEFEPLAHGVTARVAFTPDARALVTETGARYSTEDFTAMVEPQRLPIEHGYSGALTMAPDGTPLLSDCSYVAASRSHDCSPHAGRYPEFSSDGKWLLAGGTLRNVVTGEIRILDETARAGAFAPNGDVITAARDNSLTRHCLSD
jgi:WD40 repeat protein